MAHGEIRNIGRLIARLWSESAGTRALSLAVSLAGCLNVGASLLFVWATKRIVDHAVAPGHHIPGSCVTVLAVCLALQLLLPALRRRLETLAYTRYVNAMRRRLLRHLLESRWSGRGALHHGDAISRMRDDAATLASLSCSTIPGILAVAVQLAGAFVFLACLEPKLALAVVFIMPLALIVSKIYVGRTRRITRRIREEESAIQTFLQESLAHRTLLSTLMGTERRTDSYARLQDGLTADIMRRTDISVFSNAAVTAGFMAGYTVTFLWSAYGLAAGVVSFGMMTAFLQLVSQVQRPVLDLSRRIPSFINASVAVERIDGILAQPLEDFTPLPVPDNAPMGLRFTGVSYRYADGERDVMASFSHDFRPGSVTAVVGPTGSGKTTLLRLMLGLVEPDAGKAEYYTADGLSGPLRAALRHNMVYVPQGNSLVCGTVRENLLMAAPDASDAMLRDALHAAAADFVLSLPDGLDTQCFEGGGGFSEGQAQRIAIARGLLKKGAIILLDEPTSALDPDTERLLLDRLIRHIGPHATVVIVTHRRAVLDACTDILDIAGAKAK